MPSKNTKIISIRVPERVDFSKYNASKLIACLYDMIQCGAIQIEKDEIVVPETQETELNMENFYEACHAKNLNPQKGIDMCTQMIWRQN